MSLLLENLPLYSIDDHVRGLQIRRMEQNLVGGIVTFLVAATLTCVFFWQEWSAYLAPWIVIAYLSCGTRLYVLKQSMKQRHIAVGVDALWHSVLLSAASALVMPAAWVLILFHSDGATALYMMLATISVLWGGTLVLLPVFPMAVTFVLVQVVLWITVATVVGWDRGNATIVALFCLTALLATVVSRQLSSWLENGLRHQFQLEVQAADLQRQNETVSLLLREHEEGSSDWLWQTDASLAVRHASIRFADAICRPESEMDGSRLSELLTAPNVKGNADACQRLENLMTAGLPFRDLVIPGAVGSEPHWWSVSGRLANEFDGKPDGYRGVMTDVTTEHQAKAQVFHLAHYDPLTDLPNRQSFLHRLDARLNALGNGKVAVIYIDLDGFKLVNDRHGHATGDALLVIVAERLQVATNNSDVVSRLSGDEFVIKTRTTDPDDLEALCKRLLSDVQQPIAIQGVDVRVGASIGIALAPDDGMAADILLKNADAALYRAKQGGRGTYRFFAADLDRELQERADLLQDLRNALPRGELILHYQPFVDARTGAVTGYEALIRWMHPDRGLVAPLDFVQLAEESHLIVPIGAWVIRTACKEAVTWADDRRVSVNISPVQFHDPELPEEILAALIQTGLPAHRLEIELTESVFVSDIDRALGMLRRIRSLGVRVALDDFGTGYSSLSYLQSFPFDKIKIDRSFIRDLSTRPDSQVIVRAVGDIARGLNMTVTAEGVETREQAELLQIAGCDELQGYLFGRPQKAEHLATVLE